MSSLRWNQLTRIKTGFATFQLVLHLPYLTLRSTEDLPSFPTVALLTSGLHEAHVSLSVVGVSNAIWTAYCLVHVPDDEIDLIADEDSSDSGYDDDESVFHDYNDHGEGASDIPTPDDSINDPRKYWLEVVNVRMKNIVSEWRYLVCSTETTLQNVRLQKRLKALTRDNMRPDFASGPIPKRLGTNQRPLVFVR